MERDWRWRDERERERQREIRDEEGREGQRLEMEIVGMEWRERVEVERVGIWRE